jgi:DNA-binding NarL/FixJ family response regulator
MVEGLNNPQIGERLVISVTTVRSHVSNIFSKLGVSNRAEAITLALRNEIVP